MKAGGLALIVALGGGAALAQAQALAPGTVDAADPDGVLAAVRAYGHKGHIEVDEQGFPAVLARAGDISYAIRFWGCDGTESCRQLQFAASFDLDAGLSTDFVNRWNADWVVGRLSVDEAGDPLLTYFLSTEGGLSQDNFRAVMDLWTGALTGVLDDIGY